jgi:maltose O-acetyltransferase
MPNPSSLLMRLKYFNLVKGIKYLNTGGNIKISKKNKIVLNGKSYFGSNCYLGANLEIKGNLLVGPNVCFVGNDHRIPKPEEKINYYDSGREKLMPIIIENNVWIGANCTILTGIKIAEGTIIAAGSVITKSTEPYTIYGSSKQFKIKEI